MPEERKKLTVPDFAARKKAGEKVVIPDDGYGVSLALVKVFARDRGALNRREVGQQVVGRMNELDPDRVAVERL